VRLLLLFSAAVSLALSLIMLLSLRAHRRHPGFVHWTVGTALVSATFLFSGLRGLVPPSVSIVGTNVALLAALPVFLDGARRLVGLSRPPRAGYALSALLLVVCLVFLFVRDDFAVRTVVLMAASTGFFVAIVVLLGRHRGAEPSFLFKALVLQFGLLATASTLRAAWVRPGFTALVETPAQYVFYAAVVVLHLGITVTFILLTTERVTAQLVGARADLESRVGELEQALAEVKTLRGLLAVCASCKRIRDDEGSWIPIEVYVRDHSQAEFSHGLCPECMPKYFPSRRSDPGQG
jgi:hypothetical protein